MNGRSVWGVLLCSVFLIAWMLDDDQEPRKPKYGYIASKVAVIEKPSFRVTGKGVGVNVIEGSLVDGTPCAVAVSMDGIALSCSWERESGK